MVQFITVFPFLSQMGEEAHQLSPKVCNLTCLHYENTVSELVNAIHDAATRTVCHYLVDEEKQYSSECCLVLINLVLSH